MLNEAGYAGHATDRVVGARSVVRARVGLRALGDSLGAGRSLRLSRAVRWYGGILLLSLLYLLAAVLLGLGPQIHPLDLAASVLPITLTASVLYLGVRVLWCSVVVLRADPSVSRAEGWRRTWARVVVPGLWERLTMVPFLTIAVALVFDGFRAFKPAIPQLVGYAWDVRLANVDAWLHGGRDPWLYLHALPFQRALLSFMDALYLGWFQAKVGWAIAAALFGALHHRARAFYAYVLLWIVGGTAGALALASGGPVYFGRFTGDYARFAPLLERVDGTYAAYLQDRLWSTFQGETDMIFAGITAMPSMHVGMCVLMAIWGWGVHRVVGALLTAYAVAIMLGSVALGWHYAVDGYAAALVACGCWWLAGRWVKDPGAPARTSPRSLP